jgi:SAM-dependent methyltransferase
MSFIKVHPLEETLRKLPVNGRVLDVGCLNFRQYNLSINLGRADLHHSGVDYMDLSDAIPDKFIFRQANLDNAPIPFEDDTFDMVIASHIIEHLKDGISFAKELIRVLKPGGILYIEAPSERSLWLPSMPYDRDKFFSLSYYDDPTHQMRPWSPQAFYRLFCYLGCKPLAVDYHYSSIARILFPLLLVVAIISRSGKRLESYVWASVGWACYAVIQKPAHLHGTPQFNYYIPQNR